MESWRYRLAALALVLALLLGLVLSLWPQQSGTPASAMPAAAALSEERIAGPLTTTEPAPPAAQFATNPPSPELPALPRSLQGTEIDGAVELDAQGQLRLTLDLRRLYDQVLSTAGELDLNGIRALLSSRLDQLTTPAGKQQALATFERYLRYLQTVDANADRLSALDLKARLQALVDLRRQLLGEEMATAFFADEEAYQRYTLATQDLQQDTGLSAAEREARARELLVELPDSMRAPLLAQRQIEADLNDGARIEASSSDASERYRQRAERFGAEAAARMELLDRERAAWDTRVRAYQQERARLAGLSAEARAAALDAWLSQHFDEAEQRRIRSLESIGEL